MTELIAKVIAVLAPLAAPFLYEPFRRWVNRKLRALTYKIKAARARRVTAGKGKADKKLVSLSPFRELLETAQEAGFRPFPENSPLVDSRYLWRKALGVEDKADPLFYYFVQEHFPLEDFRGFLVPPLDAGHSGDRERLDRGIAFSEHWGYYLSRLGEKAREVQKKRATAKGVPEQQIPPTGRRIILLDKFLIHLFLSEMMTDDDRDTVYKRAADGHLSKELEDLLRVAATVAYDTWNIQAMGEPAIECLYVDKSAIRGDQYYDFGLYSAGPAKAVYMPVFRKDIHKTVVEERLYVSEIEKHSIEIGDFERDFEKLWSAWSGEPARQKVKVEAGRESFFRYPTGGYYEATAYSLETFERGYGRLLDGRFKV